MNFVGNFSSTDCYFGIDGRIGHDIWDESRNKKQYDASNPDELEKCG